MELVSRVSKNHTKKKFKKKKNKYKLSVLILNLEVIIASAASEYGTGVIILHELENGKWKM